MDKGLLPRRYAKALYSYAVDKKATEMVYAAMQNMAEAFDANKNLQHVIANPFVPQTDKTSLLETAAGTKDEILVDFIKLLLQNNRIELIRSIALEYLAIYRAENHIYPVTITSAAPLAETDKERIAGMINNHIPGGKAEISYRTDPDLIGGFTVNIGNERLDASVRNELSRLRRELIHN